MEAGERLCDADVLAMVSELLDRRPQGLKPLEIVRQIKISNGSALGLPRLNYLLNRSSKFAHSFVDASTMVWHLSKYSREALTQPDPCSENLLKEARIASNELEQLAEAIRRVARDLSLAAPGKTVDLTEHAKPT